MTVFGRGLGYALEKLAATQYDVVGLDWQMDPKTSRTRLRALSDTPESVQGNLDPGALYGTKDALRGEVTAMLEGFAASSDDGLQRYIADLGARDAAHHGPRDGRQVRQAGAGDLHRHQQAGDGVIRAPHSPRCGGKARACSVSRPADPGDVRVRASAGGRGRGHEGS